VDSIESESISDKAPKSYFCLAVLLSQCRMVGDLKTRNCFTPSIR